MAMRLSGLMSGMDTESIIQQLVAAKQTKVDNAKKAQTKLSWQQDAWKALNTKLQNLQQKYLSNMRFTTAYTKKTTKVSNSNVVSVITGENAVNGVQSLDIAQMAKTGYLTGAQIGSGENEYTALTKLSDLGVNLGGGEGTISVKAGTKSVNITVTGDTTISDVLTKLKDAGLNANFDAKNQRFFVSSKESGAANDFSITAVDANGNAALQALGLQTDLNEDKATLAEYQTYAKYYKAGDREATLSNMSSLISSTTQSRIDTYLSQYKNLVSAKTDAQNKMDELDSKYADTDPAWREKDYDSLLEDVNQAIEAKKEEMKDLTDPDEVKAAGEELAELEKQAAEYKTLQADKASYEAQEENIAIADNQMADIRDYVDITETTDEEGNVSYSAIATDKLTGEVEQFYYDKAEYAASVIADYDAGTLTSSGATKVSGQDAVIYLNGAQFTNSTNVFEINGLTFTALSETNGETVTVTTQNDNDGIYDLVKNFLKEYNAVINEMDKLYNADSAKGYEPLTSDEKEAMSDSEVEEWETKIKDALLRGDSNLSSISSALKSVMSSGIEVNGKTMYLFDFGINTLSYFTAAENERNAYHIDGDEDDSYTSGNSDKLKSMISSDPDTVMSFFTKLSQNLYDKMTDLSASVQDYRTYGSFYDDKKMKTDYDDYTSKIAELEEKLADYEDKWYAKFSAMETALAKMQSNASAVTALLGGS